MKTFEKPSVEIKLFDITDVLTASGGTPTEEEWLYNWEDIDCI